MMSPIMSSTILRKSLELYVLTLDDVMECFLAQKNDLSLEKTIYYLFRVLNVVEAMKKIMCFFVFFLFKITLLLIANSCFCHCKS